MLTDLLRRKRSRILADWTEIIFRSYPEQTSTFMREQKDRFSNPVGYAVSREVPAFLDLLIEGAEPDAVAAAIDRFLQIRSVQEPRSSKSLSFIFELKQVIRAQTAGDSRYLKELDRLDTTIDRIVLAACDIYQGYREKILEIKANEIRNRSKLLLERMNMPHGDEPGGAGCCAPEGIPVEPATDKDAGELKGGNDR